MRPGPGLFAESQGWMVPPSFCLHIQYSAQYASVNGFLRFIRIFRALRFAGEVQYRGGP